MAKSTLGLALLTGTVAALLSSTPGNAQGAVFNFTPPVPQSSLSTHALAGGYNSSIDNSSIGSLAIGSGFTTGARVIASPGGIALGGALNNASVINNSGGGIALGGSFTGIAARLQNSMGGIAIGGSITGTGASATSAASIAIGGTTDGTGAIASGQEAIAIGGSATTGASATGTNSISVGSNSNASQASSVAVGYRASSAGASSVAIGDNSQATGSNSVAIGAGSVASAGAVSVGSAGAERVIQNVAAGSAPTDAVNVSQLNSVTSQCCEQVLQQSVSYTDNRFNEAINYTDNQVAGAKAYATALYADNRSQINSLQNRLNEYRARAYGGIAAVGAMVTAMRDPHPGKLAIGLGTSVFGSQVAVASTLAYKSRSGRVRCAAAVAQPVSAGIGPVGAVGLAWEFF